MNLLLIRNLLLRNSSIIFILLGVCAGWTARGVYVDIQQLTCADYSTKHSIWRGFSANKDGQVRCFWLENAYPWRTRQGVAE